MTEPLRLSSNCNNCNSGSGELYGSFCSHLTLCRPCGKAMAENGTPCTVCGVPVTKLVQEFSVRCASSQKNYFVARFSSGNPKFLKNDIACKWIMHREGTQGKHLSEAAKEKSKSKPFILENDLDNTSYQGNVLGGQNSSFFIFLKHGKDFLSVPIHSWLGFHKQANYKTLTLEEAELAMKSRNRQAEGYSRWFMRKGKEEEMEGDKEEKGDKGGGARKGKVKKEEDDLGLGSDKEEDEDAEGEEERRERLRMNKKEDGMDKEEIDLDGDLERGDDWEHEETFTDDDEAVGNDKEEREENIEPEAPPPAINEEDEEEEEEDGEDNETNTLSDYGRNLKKLLVKKEKEEENEEDEEGDRGFEEDEEDDFDDNELDISSSPVFLAKDKALTKEEPISVKGATPASKDKKRKVPTSEETAKPLPKKSKASVPTPPKEPAPIRTLTEDSVKDILRKGPIKSNDLVLQFKEFVKTSKGKSTFQEILKKVGKIKKINGNNFIILR